MTEAPAPKSSSIPVSTIVSFTVPNNFAWSITDYSADFFNKPWSNNACAALPTMAKSNPDLFAISSRVLWPSDIFNTHSIAISSVLRSVSPPIDPYTPLLPNCGSHLGFWFKYTPLLSRIFTAETHFSKESDRASRLMKSRLSAEVWYSGYSPKGVRITHPTERLKPGEQNWRSS